MGKEFSLSCRGYTFVCHVSIWHVCLSLHISVCFTCPQVGVLLRHVLALVNPFAVALEEDLESGLSLTPELDGVTLDDVSVDRLFQEVGQCPRLAMLQGFTPGTWGIK